MNKEKFTQITSNYDSHRPLLWESLEATNGLVVEMGIGYGSTPFLSEYCEERYRELISFENSREWFDKMNRDYPHTFRFIHNWESLVLNDVAVLFIDHAPGERRKFDIAKFSNSATIIVAHDTEPAADHGYKMRAELKKFKYLIDYETDGAWATAVSNFIDVTKFNL